MCISFSIAAKKEKRMSPLFLYQMMRRTVRRKAGMKSSKVPWSPKNMQVFKESAGPEELL